jgi:hypothetical protein
MFSPPAPHLFRVAVQKVGVKQDWLPANLPQSIGEV